ncbi:hypothetical protein Q8G32_28570 [Priestia megaterium]|uniref:hypothetical protein n=1 Tax=Priestia megaterium TaxID=1404 RepID=UPI002730080C|nr:hypothetical protein [Priestia megaterium]MDP1471797.1 hypothetical protein [Priestia megaterium]
MVKVKRIIVSVLLVALISSFGSAASAATSKTISVSCGKDSSCKGTSTISRSGTILSFTSQSSYRSGGYTDSVTQTRSITTPAIGSTNYGSKAGTWKANSSTASKNIIDAKTNVTWTNKSEFWFQTSKGTLYSGKTSSTFYNGGGGGR